MLWVHEGGEAGRRKGEIHSERGLEISAGEPEQLREEDFLSAVTQLDPRLAGKADGAVQFRTAAGILQNISHLKIFYFVFFFKKKGLL